MTQYNISSATVSDMKNRVDNIEISSANLEGASGLDETTYINSNWSKQLGIYKNIPEFKIALDMRAIWTVGKEIIADPRTRVILDHINGWGKDTFRNILKNMLIMKRLGEDSYAEIVREKGIIVNLKPLDPSTIRQVYNKKGILIRYEQINRTSKKTETPLKIHEILHFTNKRVGDEIHGTCDSEALTKIIEANNESFTDVRVLMHRWVKPIMKFLVDTDSTEKIEAYARKMDSCVNLGENIYIPKGTVEHDIISVPVNSVLNPLPWREHLKNYFFQVVGIPQIILGSSAEFTESTAKIAYLAFEQSVADEQTDIVEQIWEQLQLKITLKFPASLKNEMLSDEAKDGEMGQMNIQPNEITAGVGE